MDGTPTSYCICFKTNIGGRTKLQTIFTQVHGLEVRVGQVLGHHLGFPVEVEMDCQALKDVLISNQLNAAHARWRDGILAHNIVDVRHVLGKLNVITDGLSRQWEGHPRDVGLLDGSEWTVSEDWEANTGLINDLLQISTNIENSTASQLLERFADELVF